MIFMYFLFAIWSVKCNWFLSEDSETTSGQHAFGLALFFSSELDPIQFRNKMNYEKKNEILENAVEEELKKIYREIFI